MFADVLPAMDLARLRQTQHGKALLEGERESGAAQEAGGGVVGAGAAWRHDPDKESIMTLKQKAARAAVTEADPRWAAVVARSRDAAFYYAVASTGVYCRPSCGARAKPENVSFHASCDAAEAAGFRPCKRCRPREQAG
ncbi:hypothetical protein R0381_002482 [Jeongeupia wiesaeckerbachi]|uniref:Ada metal-binding domain-containing protein n=1 Tax=Jeongeupia wiesaeckerbachi TaxID=3051218 RepID=UPI003D809063